MDRLRDEVLNKRPIFIVGFQRGGTGILLNLLLSHPDVCKPRGETHEVFKGRRKILPQESIFVYLAKLWRYLPIVISQRCDIFSLDWWEPRPEISDSVKKRIDEILFHDKQRALSPAGNLYKQKGVKYSLEEIRDSRILMKNLNGLIFATGLFRSIYPDATFIGLVRNGFALCEGHIRRGKSASEIARLYEKGCQKMIHDEMEIDNYHIYKFEDLIEKPQSTLQSIYKSAKLFPHKVDDIRFITTPVMTKAKERKYIHGTKSQKLVWYDWEKFHDFFQKDVNENQMDRLSESEINTIQKYAARSLEHFSYI